ncbi:MAG: AmmeMemoRadiSam system radical SAM enzyme [Candidatus Absconditabacteria bacterium]
MCKAVLYKKTGDNNVVCTACNHYCKIAESHYGICGVRKNVNGELDLKVYGRMNAVNIDPIEKKPLYHFYPGEYVLSFGSIGCNFKCKFCQNYSLSQTKYEDNSKRQVWDMKPQDIINFCKEHNVSMVAGTYNEPTIFAEYVHDVFLLAKKNGLKTVLVSNGYMSKEFWSYMDGLVDAVNFDLKSFSDDFYKKYIGGSLKPVLENIQYVANKKNIWMEITTLLIPGLNNSTEELTQIAEYIAKMGVDIPWHISGFFPTYKMLDRLPTSIEALNVAYSIGKKAGLNNVYLGNVK